MKKLTRCFLGLCAIVALSLPAAAQTDTGGTSITMTAGTPTVSFTSGLTFGSVGITGQAMNDQASTTDLVLDVNDNSGDGGGWTLAASGEDFTGPTTATGMASTIPIGNLSIGGSAATFSSSNGGYVAPTTLANISSVTSSPQAFVTAGAGEGVGLQTVTVPAASVQLDVPFNIIAGSYNSTITFTLTDL